MAEWTCADRCFSSIVEFVAKLYTKNKYTLPNKSPGRVYLFNTNITFMLLRQQPIFREQRSDEKWKCAIKT
jgi:hypothetical protein